MTVPTTDDTEVMRTIMGIAALANDPSLHAYATLCPVCNTHGRHLFVVLYASVRVPGKDAWEQQYGSFCVCKTCTAPHWRFSPLVPSAWLASVSAHQRGVGLL